jgi:hypothetical protein
MAAEGGGRATALGLAPQVGPGALVARAAAGSGSSARRVPASALAAAAGEGPLSEDQLDARALGCEGRCRETDLCRRWVVLREGGREGGRVREVRREGQARVAKEGWVGQHRPAPLRLPLSDAPPRPGLDPWAAAGGLAAALDAAASSCTAALHRAALLEVGFERPPGLPHPHPAPQSAVLSNSITASLCASLALMHQDLRTRDIASCLLTLLSLAGRPRVVTVLCLLSCTSTSERGTLWLSLAGRWRTTRPRRAWRPWRMCG